MKVSPPRPAGQCWVPDFLRQQHQTLRSLTSSPPKYDGLSFQLARTRLPPRTNHVLREPFHLSVPWFPQWPMRAGTVPASLGSIKGDGRCLPSLYTQHVLENVSCLGQGSHLSQGRRETSRRDTGARGVHVCFPRMTSVGCALLSCPSGSSSWIIPSTDLCYGLSCAPLNFPTLKLSTPTQIYVGTSKASLGLSEATRCGALIPYDPRPYHGRKRRHGAHTEERACEVTAKRQRPGKKQPSDTWAWTSGLQDGENKFLWFRCQSVALCYGGRS